MSDIYDFTAQDIFGRDVPLSDYRGKVMLIVNTASNCGFTSQYEGLETLYRDFEKRGLVVLGFPCNQFLHQEPGNEEEIAEFCRANYDVSFPMFSRIDVNGIDAIGLFKWLKERATGIMGTKSIKWNFTKFLVDRRGNVRERFAPMTKPAFLRGDVEALL